MAELSAEERRTIIVQARELEPELSEPSGPGAFEGVFDPLLAIAVDVIALNGFADQEGGDAQIDRHGARVGRVVLWTNGSGFKEIEVYDTVTAAEREIIEADEALETLMEED